MSSTCETVGKKWWTGILKHTLKKKLGHTMQKKINVKKGTENWEKIFLNCNDVKPLDPCLLK